MTTGQKWMSLFLLQVGLLGGSYAAGRYPEWKKGQVAAEAARKDYDKLRTDSRQATLTTVARSQLMEAALAVRYGNYGMAFDRVIRAQSAAQSLKLPIQKDFDELSVLLIAQKPEVLEKILVIADKIEPPVKLGPPELSVANKPAAMMVQGPAQGAANGTATIATPPAPAVARPGLNNPGAVAPAAPGAVVAPPGVGAAATAAAAAPAVPAHSGQPDATIEQGRSALLAAKELLIVGTEASQIIAKIAHAQVVLEEGGHPEFADQFGTAIKALRAHEETKARATLDAVLTSLRGL